MKAGVLAGVPDQEGFSGLVARDEAVAELLAQMSTRTLLPEELLFLAAERSASWYARKRRNNNPLIPDLREDYRSDYNVGARSLFFPSNSARAGIPMCWTGMGW